MEKKSGNGRKGNKSSIRHDAPLEGEQRYRLLLDAVQEGIWAADAEGVTTYANPRMCALLGWPMEDVTGKSVFYFIDPSDLAAARMHFQRALDNVKDFFELTLVRKDGTRARAKLSSSPLCDRDGKVTGVMAAVTDISEKKSAGDAYRLLVENSVQGFAILQQGRVIFCNDALASISGYSCDELLRMSEQEVTALVHPDDRPRVLSDMQTRLEGEASVPEQKFRFVDKEGRTHWVETTSVRTNFNGSPALLVTYTEVTQRQEAEAALRESEERLELILEATNDAVWDWDLPSGRTLFSSRYYTMLEYEPYEFPQTADSWRSLIHPEDRERAENTLSDHFEGRTEGYSNEFRMRTKSGGWRCILSRGMVTVRNSKGHPVRMIGTHTDLTESYEAEAALKESEERFRSLIEHAPVAIGVAREGKTVYGNEALFRLFGVTNRLEVIGRSLTERVAPQDKEQVAERAMRRSHGEPAEDDFEMLAMRQDGGQFPCRVAVSMLALSDGPANLAFFFDLTAQKESEKRLEDSRGKMRSLAIHLLHAREEERKNVAREIHDELGQILTALKMDLQWIEKRLAPRTPLIMEKINGVVGLADQTIQMVHRISSELRPGMLDDLGLAAAVEWLGGDFSRRNGIPCRVDITALESRIGGNSSTALFRIIQEALTNVARHAHASHASVELWEAEGALTVRVQDDGTGVTEEQATSPQSFGLIGIRERAEGLGGEISIAGRPGKGTTLTVTIPLPPEGHLS